MIRSSTLRLVTTVVAAAAALSACESTRVTTDTNAAASISVCRTFGWLEPDVTAQRSPNAAFDNPVNDQRLRTAVGQKLAAHGVQPVASGAAPDCLVSQAIGSRIGGTARSGPRWSFGVGTGWGGYRHGTAGSVMIDSADYYDLREGRVAIDIFRAGTREPLWHADADVDVTDLRGANAEKRINDVVTAIFAKYPK
jgi:hypothetical protein